MKPAFSTLYSELKSLFLLESSNRLTNLLFSRLFDNSANEEYFQMTKGKTKLVHVWSGCESFGNLLYYYSFLHSLWAFSAHQMNRKCFFVYKTEILIAAEFRFINDFHIFLMIKNKTHQGRWKSMNIFKYGGQSFICYYLLILPFQHIFEKINGFLQHFCEFCPNIILSVIL